VKAKALAVQFLLATPIHIGCMAVAKLIDHDFALYFAGVCGFGLQVLLEKLIEAYYA